MTKQAINRLRDDMASDGFALNYLPVNQAYMVTWGSSRIIGPCPIGEVAMWWEDIQDCRRCHGRCGQA
jgi:hypothetical protein